MRRNIDKIILIVLLVGGFGLCVSAQTVTTVTTVKDKTGKIVKQDSLTAAFTLPGETVPTKPPTVAIIGSTNITGATATLQASTANTISITWEKVSGGNVTLSGVNNSTLQLSGLTAGQYGIRLTGIDAQGNAAVASVILTVQGENTTRKNLLYENTFESTNPFSGVTIQTSLASNVTKVVNPSGGSAARFIVSKSDATYGSSKRSEINPMINDAKNVERWTGMQYYFIDFAPDAAELLQQWHTSASTGSPPLEIGQENGKWYIQQSINPSGGATSDGKYFKRTVTNIAIPLKKWISVVIHYKQGLSDGLVEIWIDGNKIYTQAGANTFSAYANYWKFGINKWTWMQSGSTQTRREFLIDNVRYGNEKATYNDVAP